MRTALKIVLLHITLGTFGRNSSDSRDAYRFEPEILVPTAIDSYSLHRSKLLLLVVIKTEELSSALQFLG